MTAEEAENPKDNNSIAVVTNAELPAELMAIFDYLSCNKQIVFKSQQIDDPELQSTEKAQIAHEIYLRNRQTFLNRFGAYLEERHLSDFARLAISDGAAPLNIDEHYDEMQFMLLDFKNRLKTHRKDVKNRRYAAMQALIQQNEYFSEQEMMKRAPALYQELIGQYLSEAEKKQRDSYDVRNTTFSGILMHTLEQRQLEDTLRQAEINNEDGKQQECETDDDGDLIASATSSQTEEILDVEVPVSFRRQWGNFDNVEIACSTSRVQDTNVVKVKSVGKVESVKLITAGERELLRQEFIGIMHADFLAGNDKDFDYTQVDENTQLDDLRQLDQDKEDAYFEGSDGDDEADAVHLIQRMEHSSESEESEDELDIFMNHLSKHHSLQ